MKLVDEIKDKLGEKYKIVYFNDFIETPELYYSNNLLQGATKLNNFNRHTKYLVQSECFKSPYKIYLVYDFNDDLQGIILDSDTEVYDDSHIFPYREEYEIHGDLNEDVNNDIINVIKTNNYYSDNEVDYNKSYGFNLGKSKFYFTLNAKSLNKDNIPRIFRKIRIISKYILKDDTMYFLQTFITKIGEEDYAK